MNLRAESRQRFPAWSRSMRARWVLAKMIAAALPQKYGRMLPMTVEQLPRRGEAVPRTMREAGLQ